MIWRSTYHHRIAQFADIITAFLGLIISYYLSEYLSKLDPSIFRVPTQFSYFYFSLALMICVLTVILFKGYKAYSYQRFTSLIREYSIVLKVCLLTSLIAVVIIFLAGFREFPRTLMIVYFFVSLVIFSLQKTILFFIASFIRKKGLDRKKILLVGANGNAGQFIESVENNFSWGLDIIGVLTDSGSDVGKELQGVKVLGLIDDLESVLKKNIPDELMITLSTDRFASIKRIIEICEREGVMVRLNSDFLGYITKRVTVDNVFGQNIISFHMVAQSEIQLYSKRLIDIIFSVLAIIFFTPFMLFAIFGIWITDGRPILYNWNVVGLNKKPFKSWKLRTMVKNADLLKNELVDKNEINGPVFKIENDPRIIPIGRILRKFSIDEMPQLFSVLKGDMSLVGPRPVFPNELSKFQSWQRRKLSFKPGITCIWQINGRNAVNDFEERVRMDLEYIDNWSLLLDLKILLKTIPVVLFGRGAS
ncbi:MAG: sugar transferase [Firmicutes bacterium]|nr:sugar transferase [Bacillota bacterium]